MQFEHLGDDQLRHLQLLKHEGRSLRLLFPVGKDSHVFQTIALGALLCQHGLDAKSLIESLLNTPRCTPSMLLLPQALQKESQFKGFRPSITAIFSSAACTDLDINLPFATPWLGYALVSTDTIDPKNVRFLLLITLRLPSVCYVSVCHSHKVVSFADWMAFLVENTSVTHPQTKQKRGNT